jgi:hypothetical protein
MSVVDLVALLCAVLALAATVVLTLATERALRAARDLEATRAAFAEAAEPALEELRHAVLRAGHQVDRIDDLVDVASAIGGRVDAATEVTYRALTSPVIKTVALASGTRRVARRLRGAENLDRTGS